MFLHSANGIRFSNGTSSLGGENLQLVVKMAVRCILKDDFRYRAPTGELIAAFQERQVRKSNLTVSSFLQWVCLITCKKHWPPIRSIVTCDITLALYMRTPSTSILCLECGRGSASQACGTASKSHRTPTQEGEEQMEMKVCQVKVSCGQR